jgi:hypothetical protein
MADIIKDLTNYRIKGIEKAEIEYYKQLTQTLDKIEAQIVSLADRELPRQAGKLIELQSAVAIRPKIKAILDKEYLPFADRVVRKGFGEQAKRVERQFKTIGLIPPEFQELTKGDLALVQNLKKQYYTQFKDVSNNFTRILSDKVYQNTLVGTEFTVLEKELRESINGIYATSSDPAVNRLVDYVKNNRDNPALASRVDEAVKILQTKYASTRVGENMKRYAGQILNDSLRDFDATLNFSKSKDAGLEYVKYYGDVIPTTRDICRRMVSGSLNRRPNGLFTIDEINEIWASRSWSGKKGGNPMIVRGGYNCRHQFSYVNPDWYEEDGDESEILEEATPIIKKESKVNVTSLLNPITLANIRTVPLKVSQAKVAKTVKEGFDDVRYPRNPDGSVKTRFRGGGKRVGKVSLNGLSEIEATRVSVILDELNDLAVKYDVPKLRGFYTFNKRTGNSASMGDGVLMLNQTAMGQSDKAFLNYFNKANNTDLSLKDYKAWKVGDKFPKWKKFRGKVIDRPYSAAHYYDNDLDDLRSTMYHEFGHHIHQMKYVNSKTLDYAPGFKPKVELAMDKITDKFYPTGYSKTNSHEWFAENFSLYENKTRLDLVDPKFIKLIEGIQ